jgi:hypothetical protein
MMSWEVLPKGFSSGANLTTLGFISS